MIIIRPKVEVVRKEDYSALRASPAASHPFGVALSGDQIGLRPICRTILLSVRGSNR